jgi:hypothetical protein
VTGRPLQYRLFLSLFSFLFSLSCFLFLLGAASVAAKTGSPPETIEAKWGGHLKYRGEFSFPPATSPYRAVGPDAYFDASLEGRLKNTLFLGSRTRIDTHYEIVGAAGDTLDAQDKLAQLLGDPDVYALMAGPIPNDDHRVMNLTRVLKETDDTVLYHRIDRLALTLSPDWGAVTAGRYAVTWGNGFVFNPMDLFNPFSPTDIERDYKVGDDMLLAQVPAGSAGNVQMLYVPRRDAVFGDIVWDESSLAAKVHLFLGTMEFDLLTAKHYKDHVFGVGSIGYLGDAAWRVDVTWTRLNEDSPDTDYPSLVANLDYSWIWWEKNVYGFLEFFYSGIGKDDYRQALSDPELVSRIARGELFTLGRTYLAGNLQVEMHPLVNFFITAIANAGDPSGVLQPRITWDITGDLQLLVGATVAWGPEGSEYGGIPIVGTPYTTRAADSVYAWLGYYF